MTSMPFDLSRYFPWPTLLSVGIHGAVVAGLLYTSVNQVIALPAPAEPVAVTLVAATDLDAPSPDVVEPLPEPVVEPDPEPAPVPEPPEDVPVVIHKPKPKPKPKVEKKVEQPKPDVKPARVRPASPFDNNASERTVTAQRSATAAAPAPATARPSGPRALSRNQPQYPSRAYALRMEGNVRVRFDVAADGSVENIQIVSASPANMFDREVKQAMRKWRYEAGKPGKGLVVNIVFRINGGASME